MAQKDKDKKDSKATSKPASANKPKDTGKADKRHTKRHT